MNDGKLLEQEILASFEQGEWRSVLIEKKGDLADSGIGRGATLTKTSESTFESAIAGPRGAAGPSS